MTLVKSLALGTLLSQGTHTPDVTSDQSQAVRALYRQRTEMILVASWGETGDPQSLGV